MDDERAHTVKRTPLTRKTPLKASKPVNPINRKRRKANFARAYNSPAFVRWISRLPCYACNYAGPSPRQAAHSVTGGMGRKADACTVLPLCGVCHSRQHTLGLLAIGMTRETAKAAAETTWRNWEARRAEVDAD